MALNPSNRSNSEQLALKGLKSHFYFAAYMQADGALWTSGKVKRHARCHQLHATKLESNNIVLKVKVKVIRS